jgi:hypothetical protein
MRGRIMRQKLSTASRFTSSGVFVLVLAVLITVTVKKSMADEKENEAFTVRVITPRCDKPKRFQSLWLKITEANTLMYQNDKGWLHVSIDPTNDKDYLFTCKIERKLGMTPSLRAYLTLKSTGKESVANFQYLSVQPGTEVVLIYEVYPGDEAIGPMAVFTSCIQTYIVLDMKLKRREIKESLPIRARTEESETKKEKYTMKHSVDVQKEWKLNPEVKEQWKHIEQSIISLIERKTKQKYEASKTDSRKVAIPANGKAYKVIWIEKYRTGKAVTIINGKKHDIPFEFCESWDLETKELRE